MDNELHIRNIIECYISMPQLQRRFNETNVELELEWVITTPMKLMD